MGMRVPGQSPAARMPRMACFVPLLGGSPACGTVIGVAEHARHRRTNSPERVVRRSLGRGGTAGVHLCRKRQLPPEEEESDWTVARAHRIVV